MCEGKTTGSEGAILDPDCLLGSRLHDLDRYLTLTYEQGYRDPTFD